jgi:hypothetical protein
MNNYNEYPKLQKTTEQLEKIESRIQVLEAELSERTQAYLGACSRLEAGEAALILERCTEADLKPLRADVVKLAVHENRELDRLRAAASILRNEIPALKSEAIRVFCDSKRPAYNKALKAFDVALCDALEKYTELSRLYSQAVAISPTSTMVVQDGAVKNPDIPTACGLEPVFIELFKKPEPNVWSDDLRTNAEKIRAAIAEIVAK